MPGLRGRDGNYNVWKQESQHLKSHNNKRSSAQNGIEIRVTPEIPDTDETTPLDPDVTQGNPFPRPWKIVLLCIGFLLLFVAGVILGYSLGSDRIIEENDGVSEDLKRCQAKASGMEETLSYPQLLQELHDTYINMIDSRPQHWLQKYRSQQVYSGSPWDQAMVKDISDQLQHLGVFDEIVVENYTCLVSLPGDRGSTLQVLSGENNTVIYTETIGLGKEQNRQRRNAVREGAGSSLEHNTNQAYVPPFVAYSMPGKVKGEVVNVNYGREEDFTALLSAGVLLENRIALLKTTVPAEPLLIKVRRAESYNMTGVLVYSDDPQCTIGVQYSTFNPSGGDPQTPDYPSIDGVWKLPEKMLEFPRIPVQTISCDTGSRLLARLRGQRAPPSWVTNSHFNDTLYMGRKSSRAAPWYVELTSDLSYKQQTIQNILATVRGYLNPDQVILLGASRNSFDTSSQMSVDSLMHIIQPLSAMMTKNRWLPRRTVTFALWGGGDFGHIGRVEHMEHYKQILDQIVVNIDVDRPVDRDLPYSRLQVAAPVSLRDLINSIIQMRSASMDELDTDIYDADSEQSSGYGPYDQVMESFDRVDFSETTYKSFHVPVVHAQIGPKTTDSEETSIRQTEITKLAALLMLSLADQGALQYDDTSTTWLIKQEVRDLLHLVKNINPELKRSLEVESRRLVDYSMTFDNLIDTQVDYSDRGHVTSINQSLLRLNRQLSLVRELISKLMSRMQELSPVSSDDLDLEDDLDSIYSPDVMQDFSELLVAMATANNMMRTVRFTMMYSGIVNGTEANPDWNIDNGQDVDLESGWV